MLLLSYHDTSFARPSAGRSSGKVLDKIDVWKRCPIFSSFVRRYLILL